jgi:hypothetical protein
MRLVPNLHSEGRKPTGLVPRVCAVTGRGDDPEGFILTDRQLEGFDRDVDISIAAVKEMARMIDYVSPEEVEDLKKRVDELQEGFNQALRHLDAVMQLKELSNEVEAFETTPGESPVPEPDEESDFAAKARKAVGV